MQRLYKILFLCFIFSFAGIIAYAQVPNNPSTSDTIINPTDTSVTSLNPELLNIFNQKTPQKYKLAGITVTGNKYFDQALLISVSGLNVGDEITLPGADNFSKAITKLWAQNYFSDVTIYITKLEGTNIYLEINVTERPRLSNFSFKGIGKSESDDLIPKSGLIKGRVVTENMKRTALDAIDKYYFDKGFRNVKTRIDTKVDTGLENSVTLVFYINKGTKVKINQINFVDNTIDELKLKKQMKGTKEMTRITLFPTSDTGGFANPSRYTFQEYLRDKGFLSFTKTKHVLDPYIRLKLFSSAKFNDKKYEDDKQKLID